MDLNRFKILTHLDNDAKAHSEVLFKDMTKGEIDVHMWGNNKALFWDSKRFTQWLYSNRAVPTVMKTCTYKHTYNSGTSESTKLYYPEEPEFDNISSDFKVYVSRLDSSRVRAISPGGYDSFELSHSRTMGK